MPLAFRCVRVLAASGLTAGLLAGCASFDRLADVGQAPPLNPIQNPIAQPGWRPVSLPMPDEEPASTAANSLWRSGSRAFFKDQRAARIGDILTVVVEITDKAEIDNSTRRSRGTNSESLGVDAIVGGESVLQAILPKGSSPSNLVDVTSSSKSEGSGSVEREESLTTRVAAIVTQALPNGNLVLEGRQEVRVNFEVRELIVAGIVRPEDIGSDNTIHISKIAEARVSYGGRGQITDVQQPRYGQQVLDVVLPF